MSASIAFSAPARLPLPRAASAPPDARAPLRRPRCPPATYAVLRHRPKPEPFSPATPAFRLHTPPPSPPSSSPSPPSSAASQRPPPTAGPARSPAVPEPPAPEPPAPQPPTPEPSVAPPAPVSLTLWGSTAAGRTLRASAAALSVLAALAFPLVTRAPPDLSQPSDTTVWDALSAAINGPHFAVAAGMGLSALVQALTGFGFAIVSVGALTQLPWIANSSVFNTVQPVAATLGALTGWLLLLPNIKDVKWRQISVLLIASTLTTPIGAVLPELIDPALLIHILGALITGYVLYSLTGISVPKQLGGTPGAWILGMFAGALGGAFDITGPPLVVHAEAADWNSSNGEFRRNLLTVVSFNSTIVVLWDWLSGRLDDFYYTHFLMYAIPTSLIGIVLGKFLADRMDASMFKKVVLGTCMIMGVKLLLS